MTARTMARRSSIRLAVIGQPIRGDQTIASPDPSTENDVMKSTTRWPVTVSYYDHDAKPEEGEQTPVYAMSFELFENGVSRALVLDYNDFVISGALGKFNVKDAKPAVNLTAEGREHAKRMSNRKSQKDSGPLI